MKKTYTVEYTQTETFIIEVNAESKEDAEMKAESKWENGNYKETGDLSVTQTKITENKYYANNILNQSR